jgi:ankyrin repeat protein
MKTLKKRFNTTRSKIQSGGGEQEDNLFKAVNDNNLDKVKEALDKGADVNAKTNVGYDAGSTALLIASYKGHTKIVEMLLAAGADVHAKDKWGFTALIKPSESEIVEMLLAAGADVNAKNNWGYTALIMSSGYGANPEVVRI